MTKPTPADKPACRQPALGRKLTAVLGSPVPAELRDHLAHCLACQLERAAYDTLDDHAVAPDRDFERRLRAAIKRARANRDTGPKNRDPL